MTVLWPFGISFGEVSFICTPISVKVETKPGSPSNQDLEDVNKCIGTTPLEFFDFPCEIPIKSFEFAFPVVRVFPNSIRKISTKNWVGFQIGLQPNIDTEYRC
jgi:hypothetical protein